MTWGWGPMRGRLAAYRACQPPCTARRAAMPDNVSPGCTTYLAAGRAPPPGAAAAPSVLVGGAPVLLAMRGVSRAGGAGPLLPAPPPLISRMFPAGTTHAGVRPLF